MEGSERQADYREQLLSWEECEPLVDQHCREPGLAPTPEGFVAHLKGMLSRTASEVDQGYPEDASVVITEDGEPVLKRLLAKKPSRAAKLLEAAIAERMPERNLIDVLCAGEHGRAVRTAFLLRFLSDRGLRRQITAATNKVESYNGFSGWLFFGGDGLLSENDPEEQEKRMKFKELLANSLILQNAADVTEALRSLAKEGYPLRREEVAQLSPYLTAHVKRFGDYVVDLESAPPPLDHGTLPELAD